MAADLTTTITATIAADVAAGVLAGGPSATTQNLFSAGPATTGATWNASNVFLEGLANRSCIAYRRDPANTFAGHATVIGPHTLILAAHTTPFIYWNYTDLVIDGADNTQLSSVARPFQDYDVGHFLYVTGGTGFTVQLLKISSVAAGVATCDAAVGTVASTGGIGSLTDPIYAYTEAGVVVRAAIKYIDQIPGTDDCIITTYQTLTNVQVARFPVSNIESYLHNSTTPVYGVYLTQDEKTFVGYTTGPNMTYYGSFAFSSNASDPYYAWYQAVRGGDSSSPFFFIIGGYLCIAHLIGTGLDQSDYVAQTQTIMTARSGDTLTYIDMTPYTVSSDPPQDPSADHPGVTPPIPNTGDTVRIHFANNTEWLAFDSSTLTAANIYLEFATSDTSSAFTYGGGVLGISNASWPDGSNLLIIPDTASSATGRIVFTATNIAKNYGDSTTVGLTSLYMKNITWLSNATGNNTAAKFIAGGTSSVVGKLSLIILDNPIWDNTGGAAPNLAANIGAFDFTANNEGTIIVNNPKVFGGTCTLTATHYPMSVHIVTGNGNVTINQSSIYWPASPQAIRLNVAAGRTLSYGLQNPIAVGTGSSYGLHSYGGFGTIILRNASGLRCGSVGLTGGTITGVGITDSLTGLSGTAMFSEVTPTIALSILTNSSTLVAATTSPVATDINGNSRPQITPGGAARVFAGCVNSTADFTITGGTATISGNNVSVVWDTPAWADHYTASVNGTVTDPATSPLSITNGSGSSYIIAVSAYDALGKVSEIPIYFNMLAYPSRVQRRARRERRILRGGL